MAEVGELVQNAKDDNLPMVDSVILGNLLHLPLPGDELRMAAMQVRAALSQAGLLADAALLSERDELPEALSNLTKAIRSFERADIEYTRAKRTEEQPRLSNAGTGYVVAKVRLFRAARLLAGKGVK